MQPKSSPSSSDSEATVTLLLNDNILEDSDFINHVSSQASDTADDEDYVDTRFQRQTARRWWQPSFSFHKKSRRRASQSSADRNCLQCEHKGLGRRKGLRWCLIFGLGILLVLGVVQFITLVGGLLLMFLPDDIQRILESWGQIGQVGAGLSSWPTDFTRDITPVRCHSHNDYWRRAPFYSAITAGCISVEADVWLFDEELYVGHSTGSLTRNRTLKSLYIDPILEVLEKQNTITEFRPETNSSVNGIFDTNPSQSLTLLIDFKTDGPVAWPYVYHALEPLRAKSYLTHHDGSRLLVGPVTIVASGSARFDEAASDSSNPYHDVFFDAPLDEMWEERDEKDGNSWSEWDGHLVEDSHTMGKRMNGNRPEQRNTYSFNLPRPIRATVNDIEESVERSSESGSSSAILNPDVYTTQNSFYASAEFGSTVGHLWYSRFSPRQLNIIRGQVRGAHRRGLKARYWDLPSWPVGLRNYVWDTLIREGVDLLNVDNLKEASKNDWGNSDRNRM